MVSKTQPHRKQSKSTAPFPSETILPCRSSLKSFHVTPWNLRNNERREESKEDDVQMKAWSSAKESMVQCSASHGTRQIRDAPSGWEQLHSFLLLHTVHLITVGRWTPFARQTMGAGSSSKAFIAKWLNKLTAGTGRRGCWAPHFPPFHYSGCKGRCCTMGSQLSFCSSGRRIKEETEKVPPPRTAAPKPTSIR